MERGEFDVSVEVLQEILDTFYEGEDIEKPLGEYMGRIGVAVPSGICENIPTAYLGNNVSHTICYYRITLNGINRLMLHDKYGIQIVKDLNKLSAKALVEIVEASYDRFDDWYEAEVHKDFARKKRGEKMINKAVQEFLNDYEYRTLKPIAEMIGDSEDIVDLTIDPESPCCWLDDVYYKVVIDGKSRLLILEDEEIKLVPFHELHNHARVLLRTSEYWRVAWAAQKDV